MFEGQFNSFVERGTTVYNNQNFQISTPRDSILMISTTDKKDMNSIITKSIINSGTTTKDKETPPALSKFSAMKKHGLNIEIEDSMESEDKLRITNKAPLETLSF